MTGSVSLPDARLAEIEARHEAATPGPWKIAVGEVIISTTEPVGGTAVAYTGDEWRHDNGLKYGAERDANADFIAHARTDIPALIAEVHRRGWQPIETAPRDGTVVDLWIVGHDNMVDFYSPTARKVPGQPLRHGRSVNWRWLRKPPNAANWYAIDGLGMPLSPEVRPIYWQPLPSPPERS